MTGRQTAGPVLISGARNTKLSSVKAPFYPTDLSSAKLPAQSSVPARARPNLILINRHGPDAPSVSKAFGHADLFYIHVIGIKVNKNIIRTNAFNQRHLLGSIQKMRLIAVAGLNPPLGKIIDADLIAR